MKAENKDMMECKACADIVAGMNEGDAAEANVVCFTRIGALLQHLKRSISTHIASAKWSTVEYAGLHEELKGAMGFYDEDYFERQQAQDFRKETTERKLETERASRDPVHAFSRDKALLAPIDIPQHPGLDYGSFYDWPKHAAQRYRGKVIETTIHSKRLEQEVDVLLHLKKVVEAVPIPDEMRMTLDAKIPAGLEDEIEAVPIPGPEGGYLGQGNRFSTSFFRSKS